MRKETLIGQIPLITLVVLCVVISFIAPQFLSALNLSNVLVQAAVMTVISMGMTFVILAGGFDLSVGSIVALAGCIAAAVMLKAGIVPGVLAGVAVGALVGLVNGLVITALRVNPFITTLGTMVLVRGVVFLFTGGAPIPSESTLPQPFLDFGVVRLLGIHYLVWVPAALVLVLSW